MSRSNFHAAGLHFTYPKDKKAAMRAAEILAASDLRRSSSDSSDRTSLREHPDDVVSPESLTGSEADISM